MRQFFSNFFFRRMSAEMKKMFHVCQAIHYQIWMIH